MTMTGMINDHSNCLISIANIYIHILLINSADSFIMFHAFYALQESSFYKIIFNTEFRMFRMCPGEST